MSRIAIIDTAVDPENIGGRYEELIDLYAVDSIGEYQGIATGRCALDKTFKTANGSWGGYKTDIIFITRYKERLYGIKGRADCRYRWS